MSIPARAGPPKFCDNGKPSATAGAIAPPRIRGARQGATIQNNTNAFALGGPFIASAIAPNPTAINDSVRALSPLALIYLSSRSNGRNASDDNPIRIRTIPHTLSSVNFMRKSDEIEFDNILRRRFSDDKLSWEIEIKEFVDDLINDYVSKTIYLNRHTRRAKLKLAHETYQARRRK